MSRSGDSSTGSLCLVHSTRSTTTSRQSIRPEFLYRNGSRFHPHSKEEVPYPFSMDREMLELRVSTFTTTSFPHGADPISSFPLDRQVILRVQGQLNYVDFKDKPPKRCLDIGCGVRLPPSERCHGRVLTCVSAGRLGDRYGQSVERFRVRELDIQGVMQLLWLIVGSGRA